MKPRGSRQLGMPIALTISLGLHLLLLLITLWAPIGRSEAVAAAPQEIHFDFAPQTTEEDGEAGFEDDSPLSPPPAPVPQEPEQAETPEAPEVPDQVENLEPEPLPEPEPDPPQDTEPTQEETAQEEAPEPTENLPPEELAEPGDEATSDAPLEDTGVAPQGPPRDDATGAPQKPTQSLRDRLQSFDSAMQNERRNAPLPTTSPPKNVFVPEPTWFPASGFGVGNLMFESRDYDWSDYARQIYIAIWKAWHRRLYYTMAEFEKWAQFGGGGYLNHWSQVRFVINRSGQVTGIELEQEAGCPPLDRSAVDALAEVILPPLPGDFPRDAEVVHGRFIAQGPVHGLRPTLTRLKQAGVFN